MRTHGALTEDDDTVATAERLRPALSNRWVEGSERLWPHHFARRLGNMTDFSEMASWLPAT